MKRYFLILSRYARDTQIFLLSPGQTFNEDEDDFYGEDFEDNWRDADTPALLGLFAAEENDTVESVQQEVARQYHATPEGFQVIEIYSDQRPMIF